MDKRKDWGKEWEEILDKDFLKWKESETFPQINKEQLKVDLIKELSFLSKMTVEEYTLYRKWNEIQQKYGKKEAKTIGFFSTPKNPIIEKVKKNIWLPSSPEDYLKLEPEIFLAEEQEAKTEWTILRVFIHTMLNNSQIGRSLNFTVIDKVTGKYLGIICISGDFLDLTPRDEYIGWSREMKTDQKMLGHTAIGSTIVPVQPLGYSFVGGKLMALLTISNVMEEAWNNKYGDKLVGLTTTSLYGSFSQYQNLKYWTKRGHSAGSIRYEPSKEMTNRIREFLKVEEPRRYWEWYFAKRPSGLPLKRDHKQRSLSLAYRLLDIPKEVIETNHQRGIYFCPLFENTREYLRKEITENKLIRRFDNSVEVLSALWKERYAKKRVENLLTSNRYSTETLFYDDVIGMSWEDCKGKYLKEVGR